MTNNGEDIFPGDRCMRKTKNAKGFTLVELSIVIVLFGIILTTVMGAFSLYEKRKIISDTDDAILTSKQALNEYQANVGNYPCPADPNLPPTDPNYGLEMRNPPVTGVCVLAAGMALVVGKDVDNDGLPNDMVIINGAVPFNTIMKTLQDPNGPSNGIMNTHYSESQTLDGYGNKISYSVTEKLTRADGSFNGFMGAIDVIDENNNSLMDPQRYAHFILTSHGPDGVGSFSRSGKQNACPTNGPLIPPPGPPVPGTLRNEVENCDANAIFLNGLRNETANSYDDDSIGIGFSSNSDLWQQVGKFQIKNTNSGYVGLGVDNPTQALQSAGDLNAQRVDALGYTDPTGSNVIPPETLAGDGSTPASAVMRCPPGEVATGISKNAMNNPDPDPAKNVTLCESPLGVNPIPAQDCGVNASGKQRAMVGWTITNGVMTLQCCDPSIPGSCP